MCSSNVCYLLATYLRNPLLEQELVGLVYPHVILVEVPNLDAEAPLGPGSDPGGLQAHLMEQVIPLMGPALS